MVALSFISLFLDSVLIHLLLKVVSLYDCLTSSQYINVLPCPCGHMWLQVFNLGRRRTKIYYLLAEIKVIRTPQWTSQLR